jgi:hypothetical protein
MLRLALLGLEGREERQRFASLCLILFFSLGLCPIPRLFVGIRAVGLNGWLQERGIGISFSSLKRQNRFAFLFVFLFWYRKAPLSAQTADADWPFLRVFLLTEDEKDQREFCLFSSVQAPPWLNKASVCCPLLSQRLKALPRREVRYGADQKKPGLQDRGNLKQE